MFSPNDNVQIALIGAGGMGHGDAEMASSIPGVKLIAVADCYDGRLQHMKEVYGAELFTTRDYHEILRRNDVDAVIIATPDHWHARISLDALHAGKHVYCEKPMVRTVEDGHAVIAAQKEAGRVFQVGSQYRSGLQYRKGNELFRSNALGELTSVEAWLDRNTAIGAWEYSIPLDASPDTCDWNRFQGDAPQHAWDPCRFFRWRNYREYGTGIGGDLIVHLLTGIHTVTGALGPTRIYATGGTRFWKDRDVPDVMLAAFDYAATEIHPAFNVLLHVNFKSGRAGEDLTVKFTGSEGVMTASGLKELRLDRTPRADQFDYSTVTFTDAMQKQIRAEWNAKHAAPTIETIKPSATQTFQTNGQNAHLEHHKNFYRSIRENAPLVEDAEFGLRAAGAALLANESYFSGKLIGWDPVTMTQTSI